MERIDILKANEHKFWVKVKKDIEEKCWIWMGYKDKLGYGQFQFRYPVQVKRNLRAHRSSYELTYGSITEELFVCHKCDNPSCVNPHHLFLGTNYDNVMDRVQKDRSAKGEKNGRSKLTIIKANEIRHKFSIGTTIEDMCSLYLVDESTIRGILQGKKWKVDGYKPLLLPNKLPFKTGHIPHNRSIDVQTAIKIKEALKNRGGKTLTKIAAEFGVKPDTIKSIMRGRSFAYL